jgi:hypothetical protein
MTTAGNACGLERVQRWMQAVIMHPDGVVAGIESESAQQQIEMRPEQAEEIIRRSNSLIVTGPPPSAIRSRSWEKSGGPSAACSASAGLPCRSFRCSLCWGPSRLALHNREKLLGCGDGCGRNRRSQSSGKKSTRRLSSAG